MHFLWAKCTVASTGKESAVASDADVAGTASTYSEELRQAVEAAIECGVDRVKFVNESEAVLNRVHRAVTRFRQQKFSDERQILEALESKDSLVHFFIDCVRNRFLYRSKVAQLKADLSSSSSVWDRAFKDHVVRCPTCRTVDFSKASPPPPPAKPQQKLPIPFAIELLAVLGISLPLFALGQGCDCKLRPWLLLCGIILCLPLSIFELMWRLSCTHSWVLWNLCVGSYAIDVERRALRLPWSPSAVTFKRSDLPDASNTFVSFGQWFRCPQLPVGATMRKSRPKPDLPEPTRRDHCIAISCSSLNWTDASGIVEADGNMRGLPKQMVFDGNEIRFSSTDGGTQVWAKIGRVRLEWIRKFLSVQFLIGIVMALVAVSFHPGLGQCSPIETLTSRIVRTPLRAIFLVDGSSSVDDEFNDEKRATEAIMEAFKEVYEPDVDRLHQGVVQFASNVKVEQTVSNDFSQVRSSVRSMSLLGGGTSFAGPLRECQRMLDDYSGAGGQTFDVCILITDGNSDETNSQLKAMNLLHSTTKLMGIYVGTSASHGEELRSLTSCTTPSNQQCSFFESAADFALLRARASDLARGVTTGLASEVTEKVVTYECDTPVWTLSGLLLVAPLVLWWCYLNFSIPQRDAGTVTSTRKDPQRLCTVGANEERRI